MVDSDVCRDRPGRELQALVRNHAVTFGASLRFTLGPGIHRVSLDAARHGRCDVFGIDEARDRPSNLGLPRPRLLGEEDAVDQRLLTGSSAQIALARSRWSTAWSLARPRTPGRNSRPVTPLTLPSMT